MKRMLQLVVVLGMCAGAGVLLVGSARAQSGVLLRWDDCGTSGAALKTFACTSNTGTFNLFGSYFPPVTFTHLTGMSANTLVVSGTTDIPAWWQYGASPACRTTSLTGQFNTPCVGANDYWGSIPGGASGSFQYLYGGSLGTNTGRVTLVCAVDGTQAGPIDTGNEYYAFTIRITATKTVGTGACAGCLDPQCLMFTYVLLTQKVGEGDYSMTNAFDTVTNSNIANWQSTSVGRGCPIETPTRNRTWGSVKSLYR